MEFKHALTRYFNWWNIFSFAFLSSVFLCSITEAAFIPVGAGGYTTDLPAGREVPSDENDQPIAPSVAPGFNQSPQTSDWWSSLIWHRKPTVPWSQNLYAHPLSFKAQAIGLEVGYPSNHKVNEYHLASAGHHIQTYNYNHKKELVVGIVGLNASQTLVKNYSDWSTTAYWADGTRILQATIGSGFPFVYVTVAGGDALITSAFNPTIWYKQNEVIGFTINGHHYGIFAPSGSTWTVNGKLFQSNLSGKNYYSVAILPDNQPATLELFRKHAYAFVTNTQVSWAYDADQSVVNATYIAQTTLKEPGPNNSNVNRPLMALYRHQWLNSTDPMLDFTYVSSHGTMKVVDASNFNVRLPYNGVLPFLPNFAQTGIDSYDSNQLYAYIDAIYKQTPDQRWQGAKLTTDTYWMGKNLARIAHLIPIADQVKHGAARDLFLAELKTRLQNWFSGRTSQLFYYNTTWRTLIGYPASYGSDTNLSDHHFHYGYFIMASAIVAQYDSNWAQSSQWGGMVELLIKDIANWDRQDTRFPFLRNFDVYAGHGWANGPASFGSGNNEESSSEDINHISAMILWGSLTGNTTIRDLGIYLYSTIVAAIPQYWFDVDNQVFPSDFIPNTLGIVWSNGGAYSIWWNGYVQELHGINFLPIHPAMLYLGKYPDYLRANHAFMLNNDGVNHTDTWRDIHMAVKALYDPIAAITEFNTHLDYKPESGGSKAHTYHWLHNVNQLGSVDSTITADIPHYAVFSKNGEHNHVAFNPSILPITVHFSDGVAFTVPARSIATSQVSPPPEHIFKEEVLESGAIDFWFKPNWPTQSVTFNYRFNGSPIQSVEMTHQDGVWGYNFKGLKNGDTIDYFYVYEDNGENVTSQPGQHVYYRCPTNPVAVNN